MLASVQYSAIKFPAQATAADNVMGWLWADPIGWTSLNDQNPSACSPGPCGSYGVNVDPTSRNMNGFAWNDGAGWICFGNSCDIPACNAGFVWGTLEAYMSPPAGITEVHGWAKVCNEGTGGWVSLNCTEPAACASYSYKVKYDPSTKKFTTPGVQPPFTSLAWNGNSDGTGFGYFDWSKATLNTPSEAICSDALDNDLNAKVDCTDSACFGAANCVENIANGNCADGLDNNGNGLTDCQEIAPTACLTHPSCAETPANGAKCGDGLDNDGDGQIDCLDAGCAGFAGPPAVCGPSIGEAAALNPVPPNLPLGPAVACSDTIDNDSNGQSDCDDSSCQATVGSCVPAWIQSKFGNVYAQQGLNASSSVLITGQSATYCLTTQGTITGFTSQAGCAETGTQAEKIVLPSGELGYAGTLGTLDIAGIKNGRYGTVVVTPPGVVTLPALLGGKVYHVTGNATLNVTTFSNGTVQTDRGNGLLFVEGGNLTITGNISYPAVNNITFLRNLASFGVIVTKSGVTGGNIIIQPSVSKIVGAYFAEESISTGTACPGATTCVAEVPLDVFGLFAAHQFNLQRSYRDPARAAEVVSFDGRSVANPPPGMADVGKSLPTSQDAF